MNFLKALGWNDVLAKYNLKPWQETARGLSIAMMLASSAIAFIYKPDANSVSCTPSNKTALRVISTIQAAYVNNACATTSNKWFLFNAPWTILLTSAFLFVANNYWLLDASVNEAVGKFDKVRHILLEKKDKFRLRTALDHAGIFPKSFWKDLHYFRETAVVQFSGQPSIAKEKETDRLLQETLSETTVSCKRPSRKRLVTSYWYRNTVPLILASLFLIFMITGSSLNKWIFQSSTSCTVNVFQVTYTCVHSLQDFILPSLIFQVWLIRPAK